VAAALPLVTPSATLVAVTVTCGGFGTVAGAVYSPVLLIVPRVEFPPTTPPALQVTAVLVGPVTVAVNCCCVPAGTEAVAGDTVTVTCATVAVVLPLTLGVAVLVAVMVTCAGLGIVDGDVYRPVVVTVPTIELPPTTPPALQLTLLEFNACVEPSLKVPVAVNCWVAVRATEGDAGVTAIEVSVGGLPTVRFVLPVMDADVALITAAPFAAALAKPEALIVDTALLLELQTTELVRFCVLPSV